MPFVFINEVLDEMPFVDVDAHLSSFVSVSCNFPSFISAVALFNVYSQV